jgi:hypothetical protein
MQSTLNTYQFTFPLEVSKYWHLPPWNSHLPLPKTPRPMRTCFSLFLDSYCLALPGFLRCTVGCTPSDKKHEPSKTKCSIKNHWKEKTISSYINTKTSNGLSSLLLADLSQPLGHGGHQFLHFCTSAQPVCGNTRSLEFEPEFWVFRT